MRRYLILGLALATAGAVFAAAALAANVNKSTVIGRFTPSTIPTGTFKPGSLFLEARTIYAGDPGSGCAIPAQCPTVLPDPTTHVDGFADNSFKLTVNKFLPQCNPADIAGTTTAGAESICGRTNPDPSKNAELTLKADGTSNYGSATVCASTSGTPGSACDAVGTGVVTAYNGPRTTDGCSDPLPPTGTDCPTVVLHDYTETAFGAFTIVVVATINATTVGDFGYRLDSPVPTSGPFGTTVGLTDLRVTLRRKWQNDLLTKTYNYVKATCDDPDFLWNYRADFTYLSGATESRSKTQTCTAS